MSDRQQGAKRTAHSATAPTRLHGGVRADRAQPIAAAAQLAQIRSDAHAQSFDLASPEWYLNRELTWLAFQRRVLHEAQDKRTPLLERVRFLAIVGANLDEFFMKRIGGLKQQVGAGVLERTVDGRTPRQQIDDCIGVVREIEADMQACYRDILAELRGQGISIVHFSELSATERDAIRQRYRRDIFPLVTPLAIDPAHPFPFLSNLSLNLLVTLHRPDEHEEVLARVKVPVGSGVPRFVGTGAENRFIPLEEIIANNLDILFPGIEMVACEMFRVTRNANTERDEEQADDLVEMIESELRERKFAPIVRLEIGAGMRAGHRGMLAAELELDERSDVFETSTLLGMRDLTQIASLGVPELHEPGHYPVGSAKLHESRSIFHIIRDAGAILLHHPYESFASSVGRFVLESSRDPKVRAIKMTLYRTSAGTEIIDYLVDAARNGKQVAVVVELKARLDEEANIGWASRLEEVGVHVTYGVVGLKTHAKVIQVLRMDYDGLRRYVHIGTGNYHAGYARLYSDLGLLTSDPAIGEDVTELFNYLTTGLNPAREYGKILTAPKHLKQALLERIERECAQHTQSRPGLIRFKCNALEDFDITQALYRAAQAGVRVELVIRDTCRLRPGIKGLSDTVSVVSIVGRFLEHGRIFYFGNGGDEEYFIGSADLMTRNLHSRVEILAPVEAEALRHELREILDAQIGDQRGAWDMQPDGGYVQRHGADEGSQQRLIQAAESRYYEATRLRKRRPRSPGRKEPI